MHPHENQYDNTAQPKPYSPEGGVRGKIAVISGGAAGLGAASALALAQRGVDIAILDVQAAETTRQAVAALGRRCCVLPVDVSDGAAVQQALETIRSKLGVPQIVFANAGIGGGAAFFEEDTYAHWKRQFAVHVDGAYHLIQACLPAMKRSGWGRIIFTSSVAAVLGISRATAYSAAKGALLGLMRALARECARQGITVNAVAPGYIETKMFQQFLDEPLRARIEGNIPMRHTGQPEDIAEAVAYLASQQGGYLTGQIISPNGGIWFP